MTAPVGPQLGRDLRIARQLQRSLLPDRPLEIAGLDFAIHYEPVEIGNDFYDSSGTIRRISESRSATASST